MTTALEPGREQVHSYAAYGAAADLWRDKSPALLLSGPAGTGKSRACLEKVHALMLKYPRARGLILRKTRESLTSTALVTFREHVAKEALETGLVEWYGGSREEPPQYRYANGSKIMVGGMDKPTKIMSSEYDVIYVQEAIELTVTDWENADTRLRNGVIPYQQMIADTNPAQPTHWLRTKALEGSVRMIESRHEDNPVLFDQRTGTWTERGATYIGRLDKLSGVRLARLRKGQWVSAEGLVYDEFDEAVHLVDHIRRPPKSWRLFWVVDFGFTNPFVCQWWGQDPDGNLHLYREIYRTQRLVEDHAQDMLDAVLKVESECGSRAQDHVPHACGRCKVAWLEARPDKIICDHDAEDRATLTKHLRMPTTAAKKDVSRGIQAVKARLRVAGNGKPGLVIHRDALVERDQALKDAGKPCSTLEEITGYVWPPEAAAGTAPKEAPVKKDDHGMDTTRYMVADRDLKGRYDIKWL